MTHVAFVGAVDSGKSTLLGQLMLQTGNIPGDRLAEAVLASGAPPNGRRHNTLAWLVDGLRAERETGATIDVAYRHLTVFGRRVVVHDCPGHGELTPAVFTGLSTAETVVVVIDGVAGITPLAQWHLRLVDMLAPRHVVLAVNKSDLPGVTVDRYRALVEQARYLLTAPGMRTTGLMTSGLRGDTIEELARLIAEVSPAPAEPLRVVVQHVEAMSGADLVYGRRTGGTTPATGDQLCVTPAENTGVIGRVHGHSSIRTVISGGTGVRRGSILYDARTPGPLPTRTLTGTAVLLRPQPLRVDEVLRIRVGAAEAESEPVTAEQLLQPGRPTGIEIGLTSPLFTDDYAMSRATGTAILLAASTGRIIGGMTLSREGT